MSIKDYSDVYLHELNYGEELTKLSAIQGITIVRTHIPFSAANRHRLSNSRTIAFVLEFA